MKCTRVVGVWLVVLAAIGSVGCGQAPEQSPAVNEKIPITTDSEEALTAFLQGRELAENLRATDAREYYLEAYEIDGEFAWAQLGLAFTSTTATEFFESLARATELADGASEGERLLIRSFEAGVNGEPEKQLRLLEALVAEHPQDERAQNQMGLYYFGRQEWDQAADYLRLATEINPEFAPVYNQLGYALRFRGDFAGAEAAFQRYVELIPDEPNPYDSYAELLMKVGRFDESIVQYEKALEINPQFVNSYVGIGNNLMFKGDFEAARESFNTLFEMARNDAERRQALTWSAFSYLHQGLHEQAFGEVGKRYDIAEATDDLGNMSNDLNVMGDILLNEGRADAALEKYEKSVAVFDQSNATADVKETVRRNHLADRTRVALWKGDIPAATAEAEQYREQAELHQIAGEIRQSHELTGLTAMAEGDFQAALEEFNLANQQDARVMVFKAKTMIELGDDEAAREMLDQAAHFNTLNQAPLNYALARPLALMLMDR